MSNYPPPGASAGYPQSDRTPQPQPSGCGCGGCLGKFFILLGVVFFLIIAVCCGIGFFAYQSINSSIKTQPGEVQAIRDGMTSMRIPPRLESAGGGHIKIFGAALGDGVVYAAPDGTSLLILAQASNRDLPANVQNPLIQVLESMVPQHSAKKNLIEELTDVKTKTIERTIRGEPARFEVAEGVGVQTGTKKIRVQGMFQGKSGPVILFIIAEKDSLSREQVDETIQSIDEAPKAKKK